MNDNKVSLWLEDAIAAGALLLLMYAAPPFVLSLEPAPQQQAKAPVVRDCPVTVSQYGPGERWYRSSSSSEPACAGAVVPAPNHILSMPVRPK